MKDKFDFSEEECKILSRLDKPKKIQDFLDKIKYNLEEDGETCFSPRKVLKECKANCIEGALFAAAVLRFHGYKPMIIDLVSVRDEDHIIAVFKEDEHWGAIAKSKFTGLSFREPIHKTIRELVLSYFEGYFNYDCEKTLRGYSLPVNLEKFDKLNWMTSEENLFFFEGYLNKVKHKKLITNKMIRNLRKVTPMMEEAGELWIIKNNLLEKVKAKL